VTRPKDAVRSLKKLVDVMDERYRSFAKLSVRNIESYNQKARLQGLPPAPYIVVIVDELADLMVVVGREIEDLIQRLAQMARAVGIHLVLATQRPSVDVITGVIKANLPSRIAFQVLSKTDSRVILDSQGAEDLIGRGDMLFLSSAAPKPVRLQGAFVSEEEVARVVDFIRAQNFRAEYESALANSGDESIGDDPENFRLLIRAAKVVRESEKVSGDLLRADKEIGSRYDLALILLRKKGLIEKPKDSNRWQVHF
jgi:DNA segregation ATPase FtsK/SpoIIIE, S-DNA-T family